MNWKTIKTKKLLETDFVTVRKSRIELPDGAVIEDFFTVGIQDTAMVAALTVEGDILFEERIPVRLRMRCYRVPCQTG